jgi:hypothetical protein
LTASEDRHITVAWGRNDTDVTPLKGVISTDGGTDELMVGVNVIGLCRAFLGPRVNLGEACS